MTCLSYTSWLAENRRRLMKEWGNHCQRVDPSKEDNQRLMQQWLWHRYCQENDQ